MHYRYSQGIAERPHSAYLRGMILTKDMIRGIIESHLAGRAAAEVSQAAGLPPNAIAALRGGKLPSIERAAKLLDALGLELRVCRKGEHIDPRVLRLAMDELRQPGNGLDLDRSREPTVTRALAEAYTRLAPAFAPISTSDPDKVYRMLSGITVEVIEPGSDEPDA